MPREPLPNIEERLAAAAFQILTDDHRHSRDAKRWAVRFMRRASHGRPTAFQRTLPPMGRSRAGGWHAA